MNTLQYYSDLSELKDNLINFSFEYSDRYTSDASKAQQKLLQFLENELQTVSKNIEMNFRR
jgi:hypothetical protein